MEIIQTNRGMEELLFSFYYNYLQMYKDILVRDYPFWIITKIS